MTEFFFSVARWKNLVKKQEPLTISAVALDIRDKSSSSQPHILSDDKYKFLLLPDEDYTERGQTS